MSSLANFRIALLFALAALGACGRPPADKPSNPADSQVLPFDREPHPAGVTPSQSLLPATRLPEGTPIPVRLQAALSSVSAHAGDLFSAVVDEPVVVDGQTLVVAGTPATGRVLEAKASNPAGEGSPEPGYLRIVLVSLTLNGKKVTIVTSSIFDKGSSREDRNAVSGASSGRQQTERHSNKDIEFGLDRHLSFRLAQTVDLP